MQCKHDTYTGHARCVDGGGLNPMYSAYLEKQASRRPSQLALAHKHELPDLFEMDTGKTQGATAHRAAGVGMSAPRSKSTLAFGPRFPCWQIATAQGSGAPLLVTRLRCHPRHWHSHCQVLTPSSAGRPPSPRRSAGVRASSSVSDVSRRSSNPC